MLLSLLELREANQGPRVTQHTSSRTEMGTQVCLALELTAVPSGFPLGCTVTQRQATAMQPALGNQTHAEMGLGSPPGLSSSPAVLVPDPGPGTGAGNELSGVPPLRFRW